MAFKYTIPHVESIPFTLADGKEIIIEGAPTPVSNRFSINLCTDTGYNSSEIALHFNPRFDMNQVVLTHKPKGLVYGPEEKKAGLPFNRGVYFQLKILVKNDVYQIDVNKTTYTFCHHFAKEKVRYLHIIGDVTINKILYSDVNSVPHTAPKSLTFTEGTEMFFEGVPFPNSNRFCLDFLTGDNFDTCDTALHFEVRFDEKMVSMTHRVKGEWRQVEKHECVLCKQEDVLQLRIVVKTDAYHIFVNKTKFTFNHRVAIETVHYFVVTGDVSVYNFSRPEVISLSPSYSSPIPFPLTEGKEFFVDGKILPNCNRFTFDLLAGENFDICDTALHFEVRFDEQVVSMTHRTIGEWGPIEKYGGVPFCKGDTFQLRLLVRKGAYKIFVKNTTFIFSHRISMHIVNYLIIRGDVSVNKINFPDVINLPLSHAASIPFTLTEGKEMFVEGNIPNNCNRFSLDLLTGDHFDSDDTVLHFEVRFDEKVVSMTHRDKNGNWGSIEKPAGFPFKQEDVLQLKIIVRKNDYQIIVNSTTFNFTHRLAFETVRYLVINGDVYVNKITFPDLLKKPSKKQFSYSAPIPFFLTDGKEIIVHGVLHPECNSFNIDLCSGEDFDTCDTALHFNPRFDINQVIMTHRIKGGQWGPEEKGPMPFNKGQAFTWNFVVKNNVFEIVVRNNTFVFKHRIAKENVNHLFISGDATASIVYFVDVFQNPSVPFCVPIHGGLEPGKIIILKGYVNLKAVRFSISFLCGSSFESCDIAFHYDVKFANPQTVARTHRSSRRWGPEETQIHHFPFNYGPFDVKFVVDEQGYKVTVNNGNVTEFSHRIQPIESVTHLAVQGDVQLTRVSIQ